MTLDPNQLSFSRPIDEPSVAAETLMLADGRRTLVLRHLPLEPTGLAVVYLHGIQSHPGWFVGSAAALARAGCDVFQVTRRGSGLAATHRGDAASGTQLLDDVQSAVDFARDRSGASRVAVVGVSWGGKLAVAYALTNLDRIESLTLVAPGIVPRVDVAAATKAAIAAARLLCPRKYFDIPLNDVSLFSNDPAMQQYLRRDPHRLHRATARFLVSSAGLDRLIARSPDGRLGARTSLLLARQDRIIDNDATRAVMQRLTAGAVRVETLEGAHTLEFEPDPLPFYQALVRAVAGETSAA